MTEPEAEHWTLK